MAHPLSSPSPVLLAVPARAGGSERLVEHLATVGYLPAVEDRLFFYCTVEMSRIGKVALDQLLTAKAPRIVEMRWVCYHVMQYEGGVKWPFIAARFGKSVDSVRSGAQQLADLLKKPEHHAALFKLHRQLHTSLKNYLKSLPDGQD